VHQKLFLVIFSAKDNLSRTQCKTVNRNVTYASNFLSMEVVQTVYYSDK
jgi:hypothetical protein